MLKVGIHENVVLSKATKNDMGTLVIGFKKTDEVDPLLALSSAGQTNFDQESQDFMIFPPKTTNIGGELSTRSEILDKIAELKGPLDHIASIYLTSKDRNAAWGNIFEGTNMQPGMNKDQMELMLQNQTTLNVIYNNVVDKFIKMVTPFLTSGKKTRVVFIRASKAKHYPKLRTKYLLNQPFIEPMDVPTPKVTFSKYEITNGLNNPEPAGSTPAPSAAEAKEADSVFAD